MNITKDELREMLTGAYQGTCHDTNTKGDIKNIEILSTSIMSIQNVYREPSNNSNSK